jgi:hypothetical protein
LTEGGKVVVDRKGRDFSGEGSCCNTDEVKRLYSVIEINAKVFHF